MARADQEILPMPDMYQDNWQEWGTRLIEILQRPEEVKPLEPTQFPKGRLPSIVRAGAIVWVTDQSPLPKLAYADGTGAWRLVATDVVVS